MATINEIANNLGLTINNITINEVTLETNNREEYIAFNNTFKKDKIENINIYWNSISLGSLVLRVEGCTIVRDSYENEKVTLYFDKPISVKTKYGRNSFMVNTSILEGDLDVTFWLSRHLEDFPTTIELSFNA